MKQHGSKSGLIAAISLLLLAWSCSDDQLSPNQNAKGDDEMHFFSYIASNADAKSRVDAGESKYESFNYQKCENSDIYLITAVEDGIDGTQLASYEAKDMVTECENMSAPESRAAQLTQETLLSKYLNNTADDGKWAIDLYAFKYPAKTTYNQVDAANDNLTLSDVFAQARVDGDVSDVVQTIKQEQLTTSETTSTTTQNVALTSDVKHYWDAYEGNRITFVGLFPSYKSKYGSQDESTLTVAEYRMKNDTVFEYCMSPKAANQIDFLYGQKSYPANSGQSIVLPLRHILTGIKVKLSTGFEGCKITKVEFDNVNGLGWFNIASGEWMTMTGTNKVTFSSEKGNQGTMIYGDGTTEFEETGADATSEDFFMAIPQGLGSLGGGIAGDTKIKITVKHADGSTLVHTADLNGTTWEAGKTVTYALSIDTTLSDYYIATEFSSVKCGWAGYPAGFMEQYQNEGGETLPYGTGIRVKSYKITTTKNANGTTTTSDPENVSWELFYEDGTSTGISTEQTLRVFDISNEIIQRLLGAYVKDYNKDTYDKTNSQYDFMKQDYNYLFFLQMGTGAQTRETVDGPNKEVSTLASHSGSIFGDNVNSELRKYYWRRIDLSLYSQSYKKVGNDYTPIPYYQSAQHTETSRETANCYMIQFPGYYTIPCVYGNGIHQKVNLLSSYQTGATGTGAMGYLKRHDGNNINDGWITKNGITPTGAVLLWEDSPNLIQNVELIHPYSQFTSGYADYLTKNKVYNATNPYNSSEYYIRFDVSGGSNFKPGNAVIALTSKVNNVTTVLWSWHIWVTPWAGSDRITADASDNATGDYVGKQQYLKVPLGYVERSSYKWAARAEKLTLKQYEKNSSGAKVYKQSCVMAFQQDEHILNRSSCCYYQWGRKDPFPGAIPYEELDAYVYKDGASNGKLGGYMYYDGTYAVSSESLQTGGYITYGKNLGYTTNGEEIVATSGSGRTVDSGIQHPMWYFLASGSGATSRFPSDNNYYDLWGQNTSVTGPYIYQFPSDVGSSMKKTVYDPCPYGFKVPPIHGLPAVSFQGFPCFTSSPVAPDALDVDKDHSRVITESTLYAQAINSPYTDHNDFVHNLSYEFYTNRMTLAGKPGGDTYKVYALGYIDDDYTYSTSGTLPFVGFGSTARYWSSSRWASSTAASTVNIVNDIVTANIYSRMMMMEMSYGGLNSRILPVYGAYSDYGCPILPIYDTYLPIY